MPTSRVTSTDSKSIVCCRKPIQSRPATSNPPPRPNHPRGAARPADSANSSPMSPHDITACIHAVYTRFTLPEPEPQCEQLGFGQSLRSAARRRGHVPWALAPDQLPTCVNPRVMLAGAHGTLPQRRRCSLAARHAALASPELLGAWAPCVDLQHMFRHAPLSPLSKRSPTGTQVPSGAVKHTTYAQRRAKPLAARSHPTARCGRTIASFRRAQQGDVAARLSTLASGKQRQAPFAGVATR